MRAMDPNAIRAIADFISTIGIPATLALLIILKTNSKLDRLVEQLDKLNVSIFRLIEQDRERQERISPNYWERFSSRQELGKRE